VAGTTGDLIQLVDNQSYLGQQILNVYYYRLNAVFIGDTDYLEQLNTYWGLNVLAQVKSIQGDYLAHNSREWRNLSNGTDLFVDASVERGDLTPTDDTVTPSFLSAGFMLQRGSLVTRNGYKRFAGLIEANVAGNTIVGLDDEIELIRTALAGDLNIGILAVAEPVIVKRPIAVPVEEYEYSPVISCSFRGLGTQNTRKAGRGV